MSLVADPAGPTVALPCRYSPATRAQHDESGLFAVSAPVIAVPPSDPLAAGDLVSAVLDSAGNVLFAGPARVEESNPTGGGQLALRVWGLVAAVSLNPTEGDA